MAVFSLRKHNFFSRKFPAYRDDVDTAVAEGQRQEHELWVPATPGFNMHLSRRPPPLHQHTWGTCEAGSGHNQEWALEEAHTLESDWTTRVNKGC